MKNLPAFSSFFPLFPDFLPLFPDFCQIFSCQGRHSAPFDPPVATPLFWLIDRGPEVQAIACSGALEMKPYVISCKISLCLGLSPLVGCVHLYDSLQ